MDSSIWLATWLQRSATRIDVAQEEWTCPRAGRCPSPLDHPFMFASVASERVHRICQRIGRDARYPRQCRAGDRFRDHRRLRRHALSTSRAAPRVSVGSRWWQKRNATRDASTRRWYGQVLIEPTSKRAGEPVRGLVCAQAHHAASMREHRLGSPGEALCSCSAAWRACRSPTSTSRQALAGSAVRGFQRLLQNGVQPAAES
jgi:hypothetical protein